MIRASVIGLAVSAILAATVASMAGCDSSDEGDDVTSAETIKSANVALTIQDENGNSVGTGSGILIAPKLVLTAAHLVAGQSKWKITASDGSTRTGVRGLTYDWLDYDSNKAHPRRHDVAVIYLDKPVSLGAYPRLGDGPGKTRLNSGTSLPTSLSTISTFPHAFITDMAPGESLDTGGAVLDEKNHIVGVVTGRGLTTGKLYVARTDQVSGWVSSQTHNCHSGSSSSSSSSSSSGSPPDDGIHVRTYQPPPESSSGTTSSSSGTTSSSSGTTSSSSGTTSSSSGEVPPGCQDQGDGHCYGSSCDQSSSSSSSSSSSGSTSSSSGSTSSSSSGSTSSSSGTTSSGSSGPGTIPPPPNSSSGSTSSGSTSSSSGTTSSGSSGPGTIPPPPSSSGQTSSGSTSGGSSTSSGGSSGTHGIPPGGDACQGPNDNSEACPPEPDGCQGPTCGGGTPDDRIEYGGCACGGNPPNDPTKVK